MLYVVLYVYHQNDMFLTSFLKKAIEMDFTTAKTLGLFGCLSGCKVLKAVSEVIGALLHREKVKLAAPGWQLSSHSC